jgi:uncharacterized protein (TIGR03086 family)
MTVPIDGVTALERAYENLTNVVAGIEPHQLALATCCPEWDVKAMLNHVLGGALMYTLVNAGRSAGEDHGDLVGEDPMTALAETAETNLASWRESGALDGDRTYPWGTFPAGAGLLINVGEVAIHSWDLATSTGQTADIDPDVAQVIYDLYSQVPMDDMRANGVYGPEINVPETASVQERVLGLLSRQPQMSALQPNPTTAVVVAHDQAEMLAFPDGSTMRLLADGSATGGSLSIHHTTLLDGADGASPHHHAGATEVLYILSGSAQILVDEESILAAAGDLVVVPPGTVHAFAAAPGSDVELLVAQTPGMDRFDVFRRLCRVATGVERPGEVSDDPSQYDIYADESSIWRTARSLNPTLTTQQTKDTP